MPDLGPMLFDREDAPEPSLLPHLARWVVPEELDRLVGAAQHLALHGGVAPPWFPLFEATIDAALARGWRVYDELEHEARTIGTDAGAASALLPRLPPVSDLAGTNLRGFIAHALDRVALETLLRDGALDSLKAEPARRVLVAANEQGVAIDPDTLRRILDGVDSYEFPLARRAHLALAVSDDLRAELATAVAGELRDIQRGPVGWYVALVVSRLGAYAPRDAWQLDALGLDEPWASFVEHLLGEPAPDSAHADVLRAHPLARELVTIDGLHETSVEAVYRLDRWRGAMATANGGGTDGSDGSDGSDMESTPPGDVIPELSVRPTPVGSPPPPAPPEPRRMQVDVYADGSAVERAFVADTDHEIVFWIGTSADATVVGPAVREPDFEARGVDRLPLTVRFSYGDDLQEQVVKLPKDASRNSDTCTFTLRPAAGARNAAALIAVYDGAVVLAAASLVGGVVANLAAERRDDGRIELLQTQARALGAPAQDIAGSITTDGTNLLGVSSEGSVSVDVSALATKMAPLWERIEAFSRNGQASDEAQLRLLLRDLAPFGQGLRSLLVDALPPSLRGDGPLQVVATSAAAILPLELVYDRHDANATSEVCAGWRSSLTSGACDACPGRAGVGGAGEGATPTVCPMRFWGLRRVIEHHTRSGGGSGAFSVREAMTAGAEGGGAGAAALPPLSGALVAASATVDDAGVEAVVAAASAAFGHASRARTWKEWERLVTDERPGVLILMPHQAQEERLSLPAPALEINDDLLLQGALTPSMVRPDGAPPPVVLLLGCNTAGDELPVTSFAGEFRTNGAGFVVSTLVEVVVDEAPRAAQAIVAVLAPGPDRATTFGEALLRARRAMVAEGLVFSLGLVGHGDPAGALAGR